MPSSLTACAQGMLCAGNVAAAQGAFLRVVRHVQHLAGVLARRAHVHQRLAGASGFGRLGSPMCASTSSRKARMLSVGLSPALYGGRRIARHVLGQLGGPSSIHFLRPPFMIWRFLWPMSWKTQ